MKPIYYRSHRYRLAVTGLGLFAALTAAWPPVGAAAAPQPPPVGLSVSVDDGITQAGPNSDLTYTARLTNAGTRPVKTTLTLTIPGYGTYTASGGGKVSGHDASWPVTVDAGRAVTRTAKVRVGAIPNGERRVTTLVSVYLKGDKGGPVIRSADANTITGVLDQANTTAKAATAAAAPSTGRIAVIALTLAGIAVLLAAALVWQIRRAE